MVSGPGKPPEALLRRLIADDALPDVVSADDAIGATHVDDRYLAALGGWRGRLLRRLPLLLAQAIEVWRRADEFDAVLTWADAPAIVIGALMRVRRRRPAHVVILMWPSKPKKARLLPVALRGIDRYIVWLPCSGGSCRTCWRCPRIASSRPAHPWTRASGGPCRPGTAI